jgi:hypothetical protein
MAAAAAAAAPGRSTTEARLEAMEAEMDDVLKLLRTVVEQRAGVIGGPVAPYPLHRKSSRRKGKLANRRASRISRRRK